MDPFLFFLLCVIIIMFLDELGVVIVVCLVLYNCTGDNPKIGGSVTQQQTQQVQPVQKQPTENTAPHYEMVDEPQYGDPVCDEGYNLMVDTKTGNKACILGATHY
ncbi:MAG: hypothetical protein JXR12_05940 [Neptunomonas phycophila]|uniref:hypothetical protein n=1 Tax=Neptunomonas phycophila TaxID=1572645 RepID=UPI003B8AFA3F